MSKRRFIVSLKNNSTHPFRNKLHVQYITGAPHHTHAPVYDHGGPVYVPMYRKPLNLDTMGSVPVGSMGSGQSLATTCNCGERIPGIVLFCSLLEYPDPEIGQLYYYKTGSTGVPRTGNPGNKLYGMRAGNTYRHKEKRGKAESTYNNYEESRFYEPGLISIIVPCYNEAENIEHFLSAISEIHLQPYRIEVILVNDGSRDIAILKNEWYEKNYHPEAMTWHPP